MGDPSPWTLKGLGLNRSHPSLCLPPACRRQGDGGRRGVLRHRRQRHQQVDRGAGLRRRRLPGRALPQLRQCADRAGGHGLPTNTLFGCASSPHCSLFNHPCTVCHGAHDVCAQAQEPQHLPGPRPPVLLQYAHTVTPKATIGTEVAHNLSTKTTTFSAGVSLFPNCTASTLFGTARPQLVLGYAPAQTLIRRPRRAAQPLAWRTDRCCCHPSPAAGVVKQLEGSALVKARLDNNGLVSLLYQQVGTVPLFPC